jgi:hypothetical protein
LHDVRGIEHAHRTAVAVHHRCGGEPVTFEGQGRGLRLVIGVKCDRVALHYFGDRVVAVVGKNILDTQQSDQRAVALRHQQRTGRRPAQAAQIAQHGVQARIGAHADDVRIHERTDAALRKVQRGLHALALRALQCAQNLRDYLGGQFRDQFYQFVGLEVIGRLDDLAAVHVREQGVAHRVRDLQQYGAVALRGHQPPYATALVEREVFEDEGDVRRVQAVDAGLQFLVVLFLQELEGDLPARPLLMALEFKHQRLLFQQGKEIREHLLRTAFWFGGGLHGGRYDTSAADPCGGIFAEKLRAGSRQPRTATHRSGPARSAPGVIRLEARGNA